MAGSKRLRNPISVVLADDHDVVRLALRTILSTNPGFEVLGEAASGREAVDLALRLNPDVVVMDLGMPLLNGMEATRQIIAARPGARVVALSSFGDREHISQAMAAGVMGYILKDGRSLELMIAIREVYRGHKYYSPAILAQLRRWGRKPGQLNPDHELTPREAAVLQLIAEGFKNRQIAIELGISEKAVAGHRRVLMRKLDLRNVADLVRHAVTARTIENDRQDEWGVGGKKSFDA